ncbi:hypothetical protein FO519_007311 [Halicephalobus sp. NKZ332]|nr:hypothetical protein FO519_007311 [Halicephalobus sp. NKZ332]
MLAVFFFSLVLQIVLGTQAPQCSKLHIHQDTVDQEKKEVVYSFDVDVNVVESTTKYFNLIKFFNYANHSVDEDVFKQAAPLQYWDGNEGVMIKCDFGDSCTIEIPDGVGLLEFPIFVNGTKDFPSLIDGLFFDSGIIFISYLGEFFYPDGGNCASFEEMSQFVSGFFYQTKICCREFTYVHVPDENSNPCVEFDSNTVFSSNISSDVIANFSAHYALLKNEIVVTVTDYTGPPTGSFYFSPNEDLTYCAGNVSGCYLRQNLSNSDFQFEFLLDVWDPYPQTFHYDAVTGKLIRRNGVYMKEENKIFSPEHPCWSRVEPGNNDSIATSKFCCSRFQNDITATCPQYESRSRALQDNVEVTFLDITYTLEKNNLNVLVKNFSSSEDIIGQFEMFDSRGLSQLCSVNNSTVVSSCTFNYTNNEAYEFEFRTSGFPNGFSMTVVAINNLEFESPDLSPDKPCETFIQPYNGLDISKSSKTELCCITQVGEPWPGESS